MRLASLHIQNFRNLGSQTLEVPPAGAAIIGENGQGKSNLIEAIYYLETFRSFRGAPDVELVGFGEEVFRVEGAFDGLGPSRRIAAAFAKRGKRKKVTVNGEEPTRLADGIGGVAAVVFSPADVSLVSGPPSERRRFLDVLLSLNVSGYLSTLQRYRQSLLQRNMALRQERSAAEVQAWDDQLTRTGARVTWERRRWVEAKGPVFASRHEAVAGGQAAKLEYEPSVPALDLESEEDVREAFVEGLARESGRERRLRTTVVGPHLDELSAHADQQGVWVDLRRFGSGGQKRTAALALRLAEAQTIRESRGEEPLVLLDDVFAELDEGRSERVLNWMEREESGQVIVTAPKESDVRLRRDSLPRWCIKGGRILTA